MGLPVGPPRGGTPVLPIPGQPAPMGPHEFTGSATPNAVQFGFTDIDPPSSLYVLRDDVLNLNIASTFGDTVTFTIRLLEARGPVTGQPDSPGPDPLTSDMGKRGVIQTIRQDVVVPAGSLFTNVALPIQLSEGYLLSVTAASALGTTRGQTFARAVLNRQINVIGTPSSSTALVLFADYVFKFSSVGWPYGRALSSIEGPGLLVTQLPGNPAAGTDWTINVTAGTRWKLRMGSALLTTSAVAGNRQVQLQLRDAAGNNVSLTPPSQNIPASTVARVSFSQGIITSTVLATNVQVPIPAEAILESGAFVQTATPGLLAGDQWSLIAFQVEQWHLFD